MILAIHFCGNENMIGKAFSIKWENLQTQLPKHGMRKSKNQNKTGGKNQLLFE